MIVSDDQIVALHTASGVPVSQFLSSQTVDLKWRREKCEVSKCDITVPSTADYARSEGLEYVAMPDLMPWAHWCSVWNGPGTELYWTGPIQTVVAGRQTMAISSADCSALMARTRTPLTKKWEVTDFSVIAGQLWSSMVDLHGLPTRPVLRNDPRGGHVDFSTTKDSAMLDETMGDLVQLGLAWTVVAGVPLLGPPPLEPVGALADTDFIEGLKITRDGASSYNDVLLRTADNIARSRVDMAGLNLQTLVKIDDMFGVSNAARAAAQYASYTSSIRDAITVAGGAALHRDAPVDISDLVPGARFSVDAYGLLAMMELHTVEVSCGRGATSVSVGMETANDRLPELMKNSTKTESYDL